MFSVAYTYLLEYNLSHTNYVVVRLLLNEYAMHGYYKARKYPTKGVHPPTSVQIPHSEKRPNGNSSAKAETDTLGGGHSWDGTSYCTCMSSAMVRYRMNPLDTLVLNLTVSVSWPIMHAMDNDKLKSVVGGHCTHRVNKVVPHTQYFYTTAHDCTSARTVVL